MPDTLATNLLSIRKRWGMEQTVFAALLGSSRSVVSNWERGRSRPELETLALLLQMTGLDLATLLATPLQPDDLPEGPGEPVERSGGMQERLERIEGMVQRLLGEKLSTFIINP